jgi:Mlc titration factor MtfA (ptsG expression regulator)
VQAGARPAQALVLAGLAWLALALLGGLAGGARGALIGGAAGALAAAAVASVSRRRVSRRRLALARPFPEPWRAFLAESYDHYDRLPAELRARFEDDVRILLAEKRITGIDVEVDDEQRLLVAASAVTLSLGWPAFEWEPLAEVLLYPQDFDRDYGYDARELAGETHAWGTVILSVPALRESFADPDDAYHVGLHEFAHLLDVDQTRFSGIPIGLDAARSRAWAELMEKEIERLRRGKSVLDPYGAEDPVEFFAVAVEAFFEASLALRRRHREVYAFLAEYFRQDPAAWDDARGLRL